MIEFLKTSSSVLLNTRAHLVSFLVYYLQVFLLSVLMFSLICSELLCPSAGFNPRWNGWMQCCSKDLKLIGNKSFHWGTAHRSSTVHKPDHLGIMLVLFKCLNTRIIFVCRNKYISVALKSIWATPCKEIFQPLTDIAIFDFTQALGFS